MERIQLGKNAFTGMSHVHWANKTSVHINKSFVVAN